MNAVDIDILREKTIKELVDIRRNFVENHLYGTFNEEKYREDLNKNGHWMLNILNNIDVVEAEKVRHSHWNYKRGRHQFDITITCNNCHQYGINNLPTKYCPFCGSKMDEVEKFEKPE